MSRSLQLVRLHVKQATAAPGMGSELEAVKEAAILVWMAQQNAGQPATGFWPRRFCQYACRATTYTHVYSICLSEDAMQPEVRMRVLGLARGGGGARHQHGAVLAAGHTDIAFRLALPFSLPRMRTSISQPPASKPVNCCCRRPVWTDRSQ